MKNFNFGLIFILVIFTITTLTNAGGEHHHEHLQEHHQEPHQEQHHHEDHHDHHDHHDYHTHPKYKFDYGVHDTHTGDSKNQWEIRDGDVVKGAYEVQEPDGTKRVVEYSSDKHTGFNAVVKRVGHAQHPHVYGHQHGHEDDEHEHEHVEHHHGHASSYANVNLHHDHHHPIHHHS